MVNAHYSPDEIRQHLIDWINTVDNETLESVYNVNFDVEIHYDVISEFFTSE